MSTSSDFVDQILQKYVVQSKLRAKLEEKCGELKFVIDVRKPEYLLLCCTKRSVSES